MSEVFKNKLETVYCENGNNHYNNKFKEDIEKELDEINRKKVTFN